MQYNRVMQNIYQAKGATLAEQYLDVGKLFGVKIRQSVAQIAKGRANATVIKRKVAVNTWQNLQAKEITREFCECLVSWAKGAKISPEEAMWLLADNLSGCQTAIVRYGSGVALLHTEEEFIDGNLNMLHMPNEHTISFGNSRTLVYDNLMPGCGLYGWKKDLIVAVDSLFLREDGIDIVEYPVLANMLSWMIWRMDPKSANPENVLGLYANLGELVDGYAINVVRKIGSKVDGYKLTFARKNFFVEKLGSETGSYLVQTNIVDPKYPKMEWALSPRNIWRGGWKFFNERVAVMTSHIRKFRQFTQINLNDNQVNNAHHSIQKTILFDLKDAYVNNDMGALCVGFVDVDKTSVSCKRNDFDYSKLEYLDIL